MSIKLHPKIQINLALTTTKRWGRHFQEVVLGLTGVICSNMLAHLRIDWVRLASEMQKKWGYWALWLISLYEKQLTALTAKSVPAGTKNSAKSVPVETKNYHFIESLRRNSTFVCVVGNTKQSPTTPTMVSRSPLLWHGLDGYSQSNTRATRPRTSARALSLGFV